MSDRIETIGAFVKTGNPQTSYETTAFVEGQLGQYVSSDAGIAIPSGTVDLGAGAFPRVWQYVILDASSATPAFGQFLVWKDSITFTVTTASSNTKQNHGAGLLQSASPAVGDRVWILVSGVGAALMEAGQTPAVGDAVIGGATTAGRAGITAEGTAPVSIPYGFVLATKTTAFNSSSALPTDTCAVLANFPKYGR